MIHELDSVRISLSRGEILRHGGINYYIYMCIEIYVYIYIYIYIICMYVMYVCNVCMYVCMYVGR